MKERMRERSTVLLRSRLMGVIGGNENFVEGSGKGEKRA